MRYIYLNFILFSFLCCTADLKKTPITEVSNPIKPIKNEMSLFCEETCKILDSEYLFDCNKADSYQIELCNHVFKNNIVITLDLNDSIYDIIYVNRYKFQLMAKEHVSEEILSKPNLIIIPNVATNEKMVFLYDKPKKFRIKPKNQKVNTFFSKTIWTLTPNDNEVFLDPEIWKVKGRSGGKEIVLNRHAFKDSIYYSNIQGILDICKIKDYKYKKQ